MTNFTSPHEGSAVFAFVEIKSGQIIIRLQERRICGLLGAFEGKNK